MPSETSRYRSLTVPYCVGNGVDIGSGGDPVVPHAIQVDLSEPYTKVGDWVIQWHGSGTDLPFKDRTLDFVYSSHLLEDFKDWVPVLTEWVRVLKPGGHLIIILPDRDRWAAALARGQPPNLAHKHEGTSGEISSSVQPMGIQPLIDGLIYPDDPLEYSLLFVGRKL